MHLLLRERRALDEAEAAEDLGQSPADLVLLSFSDADLGAAALAWSRMGPERPSLRLANLARLRHPMSVDLYLEQTAAEAGVVVARLLGGMGYWPYGAEELSALRRASGRPLALVAGDSGGRLDERLAALSTVPEAACRRLDGYFREGGPENLEAALRLAASLAGLGPGPTREPEPPPACGVFPLSEAGDPARPLASLVFYRSHYLSGDVAPVEALATALVARGQRVEALYVSSLKSPEAAAWIADRLAETRPAVVVNATGFSARGDGRPSPLDAAGVPVLQVALAASTAEAWRASTRGLGPADMAMQVVLPELDGRLGASAIAFKTPGERIEALEFERVLHRPEPAQVALAADRTAGWARLAGTARTERRVALVLSDYPGAGVSTGQTGHAIGLDTFASLDAICELLGRNGYDVGAGRPSEALKTVAPSPILPVADYRRLFADLPEEMRRRMLEAWGEPEQDPMARDGGFALPHLRLGALTVAVQPDRGAAADRKAAYHDPDLPPGHGYVAAYLWLREQVDVHAIVHLGAHGTLEWLPGKALAPSADCHPTALLAGTPVVYPYIVNNPGEAAAAKRRLGAVTIGHLTPPLRSAGAHGEVAALERLIDDYASADGMDRRRTGLLKREILDRAAAAGLLAESGCTPGLDDDDALARLDAYLCDVKDLQIRDGLHVFARAPAPERRDALLDALAAAAPGTDPAALAQALNASPQAEADALLAALDGRFVEPGPAGAPSRGRPDVLPTGRNLYAVDPRAVPTRAAMALAAKAAEALLQRHLEDHGDWPRRLVLDLWGGVSLRTGGEDLALALILVGAEPVWDGGSNRVVGVEITPLARLGRPRVDVTLHVSGLFRDAFEAQMALFDMAVRAIAARDEPDEDNPLAAAARGLDGVALRAATARIYGPAPGAYGAETAERLRRDPHAARGELGRDYLAANAHAYGQDLDGRADAEGFAARVADAQALLHLQDHAELDLLDEAEFAAAEGGFAAAADALGSAPALYHADTSRPEAPRLRTVAEEVARVVRGRAANPAWIAGMMRHGYRGAAEIARTLEALYAFAALVPQRFDAQFDLVFDATLAAPEVDAFLRDANPAARGAMAARFRAARDRGLWRSRRNSVGELLETGP